MIDWEGFSFSKRKVDRPMKLEIHVQKDKTDTGIIVYDVEVWDDEALEHDDNYSYYGYATLNEARQKLNQIILNHPDIEWEITDDDLVGWWE